MSTHTTHFCDHCNSDREVTHGEDDGHAITYSEMPVYDGWAEFEVSRTGFGGRPWTDHVHVCARCLADPEFDPADWGKVSEWDDKSQENIDTGRRHGERFEWAREHLGTPDRWGMRGVRQVFGSYAYGYQVGPRLADGRFNTSDKPREAVLR